MASKLAVMMAIIGVIIIPSEAATIFTSRIAKIMDDICPTFGSEDYKVTVLGSDSPHLGGCAYIDHGSTEINKTSFSVWIGKLHNGKQRCRERGMEKFRFSCQSESTLLSKDSTNGSVYVHLQRQIINNEHGLNLRCAIFELPKGNTTLFRMAISENYSCYGLSDLLFHPYPKIPKKTILIQLNRASENHESYQLRLRRSTTNSDDTIKNSFSEPRYFWQIG